MTANTLLRAALSLLSAFLLIMVILLTSIEINAFDLDFFRSEYKKLNSTQVIGISEDDLMRTTEVLLAYIEGEREDLQINATIKGQERPVFNQKEINHMVDVRNLFSTGHWLRNGSLAVLVIFLILLQRLTKARFLRVWAGGFFAGALVFFGLLGAVAAAISRDFLWFWNTFHTLIFTNDLWLLNPETDILIQIVPEQFFFDLVVRILFYFAVPVIFLTLITAVIVFKKNFGMKAFR